MISFVHSKYFAYRDFKLENLMLNENRYLTLIDFGSCKIVEEQKEIKNSFVGIHDYIPLEVVK